MSTGTITEAKRGTGDDAIVKLDAGDFAKWFVTITTADSKTVKTSILRKPDSPDPTGLAAEYTGKRWKIAQAGGQSNQKGGGSTRSGGASKDFKADPAKLRSENARSALHCAKDLVVAGKLDLEQLGEFTGKFYGYISKHAEGE